MAALRAEVKATMDDVMHDRDTRVMNSQQQHESTIIELRAQARRVGGRGGCEEARLRRMGGS